MEDKVRRDVVRKITSGLLRMAEGGGDFGADLLQEATGEAEQALASDSAGGAATAGDYMAPWIDTDECINLNGAIFAYNEQKKAYIKDPKGGPYRDLVKAAEKCTAQVIHPGTPADPGEKDVDKWIARGAKYN
jgi:pyruvate-ferredoxin/flavodoxin oxidoreductase